jgi:hypothetical protein
MVNDKRFWLIAGLTILAVLAIMVIEPVRQNEDYHQFADNRTLLSIPNFFNVISNLPFLIIGTLGISQCLNRPAGSNAQLNPLIMIYRSFFFGVLLIGLGSAYYHIRPNNFGLLWDRIPMTVSFTAFFCAVIGECISAKSAKLFLAPLLLVGVSTVYYWYITESHGQGDLRPYLLVQFLPMALIPLIYWLFDGKNKNCAYVWPVLVAYFLAKIAESMDNLIFQWLGFSGHSLKHLLASLGTYFVFAYVCKYKPLNNP